MYRSFSVRNFRGFDDLTLDGLGRINLIAGKNNSGKTALLEALWVHIGAGSPDRILQLDSQRGIRRADPESTIDNLFFGFDHHSVIEFSAKGDWSEKNRLLRVSTQEHSVIQFPLDDGVFDDTPDSEPVISQNELVLSYIDGSGQQFSSTGWLVERTNNPGYWTIETDRDRFTGTGPTPGILLRTRRSSGGSDARNYSRLEIRGQHGGVLQILQEIEPRLKRLVVASNGPLPAIYADVGVLPLTPVQLLGEGMSRTLTVALAMCRAPDGMVLVDEVENGLHHSVMEEVWKAIGSFARSYNVQLFATTHSYECIGAAYRAFELDEEDELRLYRIDRSRSHLRAVRYDRERIGCILESGMEVI